MVHQKQLDDEDGGKQYVNQSICWDYWVLKTLDNTN